jgi:hypothetical protein
MNEFSRRRFIGATAAAGAAILGVSGAAKAASTRPVRLAAATFPSVLKCQGRTLVDSSGTVMPLMTGFDVQPVPWSPPSYVAMYNKGARLIRTMVFWDKLQPNGGTLADIDSTYVENQLDVHIQLCVAAGLYTTISFYFGPNGVHMPMWAETVYKPGGTGPPGPANGAASAMANYVANGQTATQYLAKRYGDPSDPLGAGQYTPAVIGFGINEPTPDATTGVTWETDLFGQQVTMANWFRAYAPNWIITAATAWAGSAPVPNATGSGQTRQAFNRISSTPFSSAGGNWMLEVHDYYKCLTTPGMPNFDGRNTTTGASETVANGGTQINQDSSGYPNYPPSISGITRTICQEQQTAWMASYLDYCQSASVPLFIGEQGWDPVFNTSGGSSFIADKIALWKTLNPVSILYWDYDTNQGQDPFSARPGAGAAGAPKGGDGWLTVVDTFMSTAWPQP